MEFKKVNTILEWLATVVTIAAALATALSIDPLNIYLFNIGSVLWLVWAVRIKRASLVVVNVGLLAVYVYGFIVRI
jgi:4-hydroxybenzoate polyprenyltransferase